MTENTSTSSAESREEIQDRDDAVSMYSVLMVILIGVGFVSIMATFGPAPELSVLVLTGILIAWSIMSLMIWLTGVAILMAVLPKR